MWLINLCIYFANVIFLLFNVAQNETNNVVTINFLLPHPAKQYLAGLTV